MLENREPLVINERANEQVLAMGQSSPVLQGTRPVRRLRTAGRGRRGSGVISLQNLDRENAFSEGDVRLLTTIAASLASRSRMPA